MAGTAVALGRGTTHRSSVRFLVGAAVESFTPPRGAGAAGDPANCLPPAGAAFSGPRQFVFEEPYVDAQGSGHYDLGDPYLDCNQNGRWDGNLLGGGGNNPRFYDHVADDIGARALVVSNASQTIALEVVDQEGLFNVYADRIRQRVAQDGYRIDDIQISATHDESAPDSLGLGGVTPATSGTNQYFADYLVAQSAKAIEDAYRARRQATIRYAQAIEPSNLRQCWSSYPYIDDQLMPVMQAVGSDGRVIATLASVSQHAETLGFNTGSQTDNGSTLDQENRWISGDWPHFFRTALEQRYGGVGIEMAGAVGSVETPEVFMGVISRHPQRYYDATHPAGCRTLFAGSGAQTPLGYYEETTQLGQDLAGAVENALSRGAITSRSSTIWAATQDVCLPVDNLLFKAAALGGVFAERPAYLPGCQQAAAPAPSGQTVGTSIKSEVAAWRIGDAEFIGLPGEVFPFTYFRGPAGSPGHERPDRAPAALAVALHAHPVPVLRRPRQRHGRLRVPAGQRRGRPDRDGSLTERDRPLRLRPRRRRGIRLGQFRRCPRERPGQPVVPPWGSGADRAWPLCAARRPALTQPAGVHRHGQVQWSRHHLLRLRPRGRGLGAGTSTDSPGPLDGPLRPLAELT